MRCLSLARGRTPRAGSGGGANGRVGGTAGTTDCRDIGRRAAAGPVCTPGAAGCRCHPTRRAVCRDRCADRAGAARSGDPMASGGPNCDRCDARSRPGAGALSGNLGIGAALPRLGSDRSGVSGDGGVMSLHALILEPFQTLAFMRAALVACLALALMNGVVGTLLVLRRMSLDGEVLGHAVMPGAAVGFLYAGPSLLWLSLGGLASGLAVAALGGLIARGGGRRDAGLVAFYLVALSLGVALVAWRGSNVDVMRVLFGTVLAIDRQALLQIAAVSSIIVLVIAALYRPLAVGAFDPAFLRAVGARAPYGAVFSTLVVLGLVASFQAFGTLLAVGPMLLPAAAARCGGLGAAGAVALATGFGLAASVVGLLVSYHVNLPSGPAIVLAAALLFGFSLAAAGGWRRLEAMVR